MTLPTMLATAARRAWRRLRIRCLQARERQLQLHAASLCRAAEPDAGLQLALALAQSAALRCEIALLEQVRP